LQAEGQVVVHAVTVSVLNRSSEYFQAAAIAYAFASNIWKTDVEIVKKTHKQKNYFVEGRQRRLWTHFFSFGIVRRLILERCIVSLKKTLKLYPAHYLFSFSLSRA